MPSTRMASSSQDADEGSSHLIECTGKGQNGKGCVAWIPTWLPKKIPKGFMNRPFLCGFCAASEASELREKQSQDSEQSSITGEPAYSMQILTSNMEGEIMSEYSE